MDEIQEEIRAERAEIDAITAKIEQNEEISKRIVEELTSIKERVAGTSETPEEVKGYLFKEITTRTNELHHHIVGVQSKLEGVSNKFFVALEKFKDFQEETTGQLQQLNDRINQSHELDKQETHVREELNSVLKNYEDKITSSVKTVEDLHGKVAAEIQVLGEDISSHKEKTHKNYSELQSTVAQLLELKGMMQSVSERLEMVEKQNNTASAQRFSAVEKVEKEMHVLDSRVQEQLGDIRGQISIVQPSEMNDEEMTFALQAIATYISDAARTGIPITDIKSNLLMVGWPEDMVTTVMKEIVSF